MADKRRRVDSRGRITYQVRFIDKSKASGFGYKSFSKSKEADHFKAAKDLDETGFQPSTLIKSVHAAVDRWLDICVNEGTENHEPITRYTEKTYRYRAEIMKSYDWPVLLQDLRPSHIQEFKGWLLRNCVSRHQAMKVLSSFHSVMREMLIRDIVVSNPVSGISVRMDARYQAQIVPPTEQEVAALLTAADRLANSKDMRIGPAWERYRPILYLAVDTGARPQEYLALPKRNLGKDEIRIDQAVERGGYRLSVTKTAAGRRWIDASPDVLDMVRRYADDIAIPNKYDLVFPNEAGRWQCPGHWRKRGFGRACEEAGLMVQRNIGGRITSVPKYSPYDIRHFYASMLIDEGTNLKKLQTLLGHEDVKTTLNSYGHLIDRAEAANERKRGLVSRISEK